MATIRASGNTEFGNIGVIITGNERVERIDCSKPILADVFQRLIDKGDGWIANGYHPEGGTMLQAFALISNTFRERDISVDGDIGEMECENGVVY